MSITLGTYFKQVALSKADSLAHPTGDMIPSWWDEQTKILPPSTWFLLFAAKDKTVFFQVTLRKYSSILIWPRTPWDLFCSKGSSGPCFRDRLCFWSLSPAWQTGYPHGHQSLRYQKPGRVWEPFFFLSSWALSTDPPRITSLHC